MSFNLWQRGHQYYFRIPVPRKLRTLFLTSNGKPKNQIVEPIGSDYESARVECARRVARWTEVFTRLKAGETLEDIKRSDEARERERVSWGPLAEPMSDVDKYRLLSDIATSLVLASAPVAPVALPAAVESAASEAISQAAAAMYAEMERDKRRQATVDGHKLRVRAFVEACGDVPLANVTRAIASDWLDKIGNGRSNRTRNAYAMTMALVIETARKRGRYQGDNPFNGQKAKAEGASYQPFTTEELHKLFAALPREVKPAQHTPESALPWVALIAAYTGMRLEEIAQLAAKDIREQQANGATIWVIDIHNGGNNALKNKVSARFVPVHSELVRAGLLQYVASLPKGSALFPGLVRRESKGGKIGARLGELFRKQLIALNLKREGLCFHSFRHTVAGRLEAAAVSQTDAARVLGHAIAGMSYGVYSSGPGLKRLAAVVEEIRYEGMT